MSASGKTAVLPLGFKACGISANIKRSAKKDLALIYSEAPCVASAVFTDNRLKAAPVIFCEKIIRAKKPVHAIVVNSGNANCMTGVKGTQDTEETARLMAGLLQVKHKEVLVSSTGIIGRPLPIEKIRAASGRLIQELSRDKLYDAAVAIMTTDTFAKTASKRIRIGQKTITVSGIAKGAGMIAPSMKHATMLAYILTDACVSRDALDKALGDAVGPTFNSITIDGCMSTNDTVIVLANGESGEGLLTKASSDFRKFSDALKEVCMELAKMMVRDAEGATKFIEIAVCGTGNTLEARRLAFSIANSNLFKCAMFGNDPNWGRIAAALGSVPSSVKWQKLDITLNGKHVFKNGKPVVLGSKDFLKTRDVRVGVDFKCGKGCAVVYTSDLSYEYVRINAEYN